MIYNTLLVFVTGVSLAAGSDCIQAWGKCGGSQYDGATCCVEGYKCEYQDEWYSQCVPGSDDSSPQPSPTQEPSPTPEPTPTPTEERLNPPPSAHCNYPEQPYAKCGGEDYSGDGCCVAGYFCNEQSQWYSNCQPNSSSSSDPTSPPVTSPVTPATPKPTETTPVTPKPTSPPVDAPVADPTPRPTPEPTNAPVEAPVEAPTPEPTPAPVADPSPTNKPTAAPAGSDDEIERVLAALRASNADGVFRYETPTGQWAPSDLYKWEDMIEGVKNMAYTGVGSKKLWVGSGAAADTQTKYGLVNVAAFLAQSMQESIRYNACDENNWSDAATVAQHGGTEYSATSACGQLHQSYQDYTCSAEEDELAGGQMACDVDPDMEMRAYTHAKWYGAPAALFCAPKSKVPKAPRWDHAGPWCAQEGGYDYVEKIPADQFGEYLEYVNNGGGCRDYVGQQSGGWVYCGANGDEACEGSDAPLFGQAPRTDVEGCCWWGRGAIQSTGTCNYGKLSFYLGKKGADAGRNVLYPEIDFCKNPNAVCDPDSPPEVKWVAGFFYWLNAVQGYNQGGWNYQEELKKWVDNGSNTADVGFIDGASGIVNRGCHNPPFCGTGELHAAGARRANFKAVLQAMGIVA